ncbi:MAG: lamin tail domain-containing protein [Anaerolineae bacterium]|jgi:hypothetical protein|nr:lamin tail domain-containing protein [Anaerolineae bacterium]
MSDFPSRLARPAAALWAAGLFSLSGLAAAASDVVISQLYGGNGNTYNADYVELFNRSSGAVDVTGWSVQYASATGTGHFSANGVTTLAGSMQPGQYLLVRLATAATGAALPMPDASGGSNLSATGGKLALVSSASGLACNGGSAPCSAEQLAQIADLVGYGSANFKEGAATAPAGSGTTALFRAGGGCVDTDQNGADFSAGAPAPRQQRRAPEPLRRRASQCPHRHPMQCPERPAGDGRQRGAHRR